jgi:predicted methyltransferase
MTATVRTAAVVAALAACSHAPTAAPAVPGAAIVAAPDRIDKDRKLDPFRKPAELIAFTGVAPGLRMADLGAGAGYSTELFARAVGPTGSIIAQDTPNWDGPGLTRVWEQRLGRPIMKNTTHVMRKWDEPLPPEAKELDLVTFVGAYHDVVAEKDDPDKLNQAVFAALKPGGAYIVLDNSARAGRGTADCEPLHRIDEQLVREQVLRAGFKLAGEGTAWRNPADARDWNADPGADARTHTQDMFALKFVKP